MADSLKRLLKLPEELQASEGALRLAAELGVTMIVARTKKGLDADGKKFIRYAFDYMETREKKGLRKEPPDLAVTGHMLGAIVPVVDETSARIGFASPRAAEIASYHVEGTSQNMPERDFFDIRLDAELDAIAEVLADDIVDAG